MKVFVTGASGFIGSAIIPELIQAGHKVIGLARSDASASAIVAAGAEVHRGDLQDLDSLRSGAAKADGVIHTGFVHDFSRFQEVCEIDRQAITAMGEELKGSKRPFVITSGTGMGSMGHGQIAKEDVFNRNEMNPRRISEITGEEMVQKGVNVMALRLPQVHDPLKQGMITFFIAIAKQKGVSAYVADGKNRWPAVHRLDAAQLYRLVLEKGETGARYNAVGEEGVEARLIAEAVARGLNMPAVSVTPEEAAAHFGWLSMFANLDMSASSAHTRTAMNWNPTGPTLLADLDQKKFV